MSFVCIGWGSLIWSHEELPVRGAWFDDGPLLPVEYARQSNDKRITLVICRDAELVTTLWAYIEASTIDDAMKALADREKIKEKNIAKSIGFWTPDRQFVGPGSEGVAEWARSKDHSGVVWTALPPKIGNDTRKPTADEVIEHLSGLSGKEREVAEEYIRRTPRQIRTQYREVIESQLGWTPEPREDGRLRP
jgi:hypothetical protein